MKLKHFICLVTTLLCVGIYWNITVGSSSADKDKTVKAGFIYVGDSSNAYTFNFIRAEREIAEKYGSQVQCIAKNNVPEGAEADALDALISDGCDIIFATSYGYCETVKTYAKHYPNIEFVMATGDNANVEPVLDNYHTFMGKVYQCRYISGVVAGMKLKELINDGIITPDQAVIGYVGAYPYAEVISGYTAFLLGVRSEVPEATMLVKYSNSWNDFIVEKKITKELIDKGCVIISQHSDTSGPASVCEATDSDTTIFHVGYNQSMIDIAPTTSLIGCRINWNPYMLAAVEAVLNDKEIEDVVDAEINGNDAYAGFERDWVQMLEPNNLILAKGTVEKIEKIKNQFINDEIEVFKGNYIGVNPYDENDMIDLRNGYEENAKASAPSFNYVLKGIITVLD